MTKQGKKVAGVIIAYKAVAQIEALYNNIPKDYFDILFISNDTAGDGTKEIADRLGVPCFEHPRLNYGGNIKYGIQKAAEMGADYVVEIHGDNQYDTSFIIPAVEEMEKNGHGLVFGSRFIPIIQPLKDKMPLPRYLANIGLSVIDRIVLGTRVSELHSGARVYNVAAMKDIDLSRTANDYLFSFEIIAQMRHHKYTLGEVPVRCYYAYDHHSINYKQSTKYAFQTFGILFWYILAKFGVKSKLFH